MIRASCLCLLASLVSLSAHAAAQHKKHVAGSSGKFAPRVEPLKLLARALALNTVFSTDDPFAACAKSDFKLLALALQEFAPNISISKSEYETEAEFAARRSKLEAILNQSGNLIVCQPLNDNDDAPFLYNADREVFSGSFNQHQNVWRDMKRTGSYVSRTRMGVRATVTSSVDLEYDVTFGSSLSTNKPACLSGSYKIEYQVPVPRAQAQLLKARGYLVFTGRLTSPFVESSDSPGEPTLDNPNDVFERNITVHVEASSVAVVGPGGLAPWKCTLSGDASEAVH